MKRIMLLIFFMLICTYVHSADVKITALPNDANPSTDDLVVTVNDPGGTAQTRKATIAALLVDGNIPNNITIDSATSAGTSTLATFATSAGAGDSATGFFTTGEIADAQISNTLTVTGYMQDTDIDTFSELQAWIPGATIVDTTQIDTISELNTIVTDATILVSGGTLTSGKYCTADGTGGAIDCNSEGGTGTGTIDGSGSAGTVGIWSAANTISYDADLSFSGNTLTVANSIVVDYISSTGATTTVLNTLRVDTPIGAITFPPVSANPCDGSDVTTGSVFLSNTTSFETHWCECDGATAKIFGTTDTCLFGS